MSYCVRMKYDKMTETLSFCTINRLLDHSRLIKKFPDCSVLYRNFDSGRDLSSLSLDLISARSPAQTEHAAFFPIPTDPNILRSNFSTQLEKYFIHFTFFVSLTSKYVAFYQSELILVLLFIFKFASCNILKNFVDMSSII